MNSKRNISSKKVESTFPCKICPKNVSDNDDELILYDFCQTWFHIKCNHLNYIGYKYLQGCNEPWYCLSCTNTPFPFETRIPKNGSVTQNTVLNNYSSEHTPTESSPGGTLLYIANHLSCKSRSDLKIYNPKMDVTDFNNNFLNNLLKENKQEQKSVSFSWFQYWSNAL